MLDLAKIKIERISHYRRMKLTVMPNSTIILRCSKSESEKTLLKFILQHQNWIEKIVSKSQKLQFKYPQITFVEGENFKFLGQSYLLKIEDSKVPTVFTKGTSLVVRTSNASIQNLRELILDYYFQTAQRILPERVTVLAQETGLIPKKISLRKQKTLWGSCTHEGHIQLNWKLIAAPLSVIDYVIVHELAHLKHPNHSKRFWAEVEKFCPDYRVLRKWLRKEHYAFDFFNECSELHAHAL